MCSSGMGVECSTVLASRLLTLKTRGGAGKRVLSLVERDGERSILLVVVSQNPEALESQ